MPGTIKQIIERAMRSLGVLAQGEQLEAAQVQDGLDALREMLDAWSLKGVMIPFRTLETFNINELNASYTWGTGGDFNSPAPVEIYDAYISDGSGADWPLKQLDAIWWAQQKFKLVISRPVGFWYEPGTLLSTIRFDVLPFDPSVTFISGKPLDTTQPLTATLGLPIGYSRAMRWCLAGELAPEYEIEIVRGSVLWSNIKDAKRTVMNRYARAPIARFDKAMLPSGHTDYSIESGPVGH